VQQQCIPQAILGMDVLCQAKSGMGKTAVFVLSTLQELDIDEVKSSDDVLVLAVVHTRELAYQIQREYARFAKYLPGIRSTVFYGGEPYAKHVEALKTLKPQVVTGTPGRLLQLVREGHLKLNKVKHFIVDECDQVLEKLGRPSGLRVKRSTAARGRSSSVCVCACGGGLRRPRPCRHARRRARNFPRHAAPEAGHDVHRHAVQGYEAHLQEVYAQRAGPAFACLWECAALIAAIGLRRLWGRGSVSRTRFWWTTRPS
jgi:hypothetical protein